MLSPNAAEMTAKPTNRAWLMSVLVAVYASNFVDRTIVNILQQPIKVELGLQDWQLGLLGGTTFAVFYTFLGIYVARIAERGDRITILTVCIILWSLFTTLGAAATSYVQLLLLRIGVAVGEAGATPTGHSLISDYYPPEKRAGALAIFGLGNTLGSVLGALIGSVVGYAWGWRWALVVAGAPGLVLAAIAYFTLRDPRREQPVAATDVPPLIDVVKLLAGKATFRQLTTGTALMLFASFGFVSFGTSHMMRTFDLSLLSAGMIGGVGAGLALGVGTVGGGFLSQHMAKRDRRWILWTPALAQVAAAPLCLTAFLATSLSTAIIAFLVMLTCLGVFQGPMFSTAHSLVTPRMRATSSAILLLLITLFGMGLGPLLLGIASDTIATSIYADGNFAAECLGGASSIPVCQRASAQGLQFALASCAFLLLWSAIHYGLAGRSLPRDVLD